MRYKDLREARTRIENAIIYVAETHGNIEGMFCGRTPTTEYGADAVALLNVVLKSVRMEIKRPDLFELDGSMRQRKIVYA